MKSAVGRSAVLGASIDKARVLMEAMPYIRRYRGRTLVVKYGGSAMADENLRRTFAGDISLLALVGIRVAIVHGGGPQITRAMGQAGVEPEWVEGLRVTDAETMRVVQATLAGEINPDIVRLLSHHGTKAVGVTGIDGHLFVAEAQDSRLGFVGQIVETNPALVSDLLEKNRVPVVAPLAGGRNEGVYNLNADTAAGALAEALGAEKLIYLTDVEGLYRDLGDKDTLISQTTLTELESLVGSGSISAGMLPKLASCVHALRAGVEQVHILDGRVEHALLLEIFTPEGIGTMVDAQKKDGQIQEKKSVLS